MSSRAFLAVLCALAAAQAVAAQAGVWVPANVVATWAACPVKKPAEWDPKVFDPSLDSLTNLADYTKTLSKECQNALLDLAGCASDNDAFAEPPSTITSLSTSNGCCLTECSNNIKSVVKKGCFDSLLKVICSDPKAAKYKTGLFNAGVRCANFVATCSGTPASAAPLANATAAAANATAAVATNATAAVAAAANKTAAAVTSAAANMTSAATTTAAAAVSNVTAKMTSGAAGAAASMAAAAVAGVAALLVL